MNTTLTAPRRHDHPPQSATLPARRVGVLDRIALRLGLALITWGRRPVRRRTPSRERLIALHEQSRALEDRERAALLHAQYSHARRIL